MCACVRRRAGGGGAGRGLAVHVCGESGGLGWGESVWFGGVGEGRLACESIVDEQQCHGAKSEHQRKSDDDGHDAGQAKSEERVGRVWAVGGKKGVGAV